MSDSATPVAGSGNGNQRNLNFIQRLLYSSGEMGVNLSPGIVVGWLIYFYTGRTDADGNTIFLVSAWAIAGLNLFGRIVDSLADPLVGYYSDRLNTRWGRRIPWVVIGTPFLALFTIMMWFPPQSHPGWANTLWLAVALGGFWFFYTAVVAPYLALLPEISPYNNERIGISEWMAYFDVLGMLVATVVAGIIYEVFSGGLSIGPLSLTDGYKVGAVFIAALMALCFYLSVWKVREKPFDKTKAVPFNFIQAFKSSLTNPWFWPYVAAVSFFRISVDVVVAMIPFMVSGLMGYGESVAGGLQGIIIIVAAVMFPVVSKASVKHGKKKIFLIGLLWFAVALPFWVLVEHFPFMGWAVSAVASVFGLEMSTSAIKLTHCIVLFVSCAFPISTAFVLPRPIFADVIDHDEKLTGYRREAMYNGMEGLLTKAAAGIAGFMVPLLIKYLGGSIDRPWGILVAGPLSGFILFFGYLAFKKYPYEK